MEIQIYLPLVISAVLGLTTPFLVRRIPPVTAVMVLVISTIILTVTSTFVLGALAFTLLAQFPPIAALGHWSGSVLASSAFVPHSVLVGSLIVLAVLALATVHHVGVRSRELMAAHQLGLTFERDARRQLHIVDEDVGILALPSTHGGHIIASRRILAALQPLERRAVLAHESAHLAKHHHIYRMIVDLGATLNPLLRPLSRSVRFATERWADEAAAEVVGDRRVVARALARASLFSRTAQPGIVDGALALEAAGTGVVDRVNALLKPKPRHRPALILAVTALLLVSVTSTVDAQRDTAQVFHQAKTSPAHALQHPHLHHTGAQVGDAR
ncbi:MAG: M48 family metalloprotease [Nocardioidaceae bacterium]